MIKSDEERIWEQHKEVTRREGIKGEARKTGRELRAAWPRSQGKRKCGE